MALVSSSAVWITEQLPIWIIAIQCAVFTLSYATRLAPPNFRRSPVWLNVFMAGITTVTIRSALEGNPATISLAYFTSLALGLQLLDARPRKSEFVLVALALFQVILASSLTDSILFPPLLVIFLGTVTWTLLVHTLSMEASEAGDPTAASRAIAPDLRRMTFLATTACLVLAGVLFVTLPRLKTNMLRGGLGRGLAVSGFSDRVTLGDVGRIRQDQSIVLRVETIEGDTPTPAESYWRGLAFDHFDGANWSISTSERVASRRPVSGIGRFGIELAERNEGPILAQRILREPVEAGVLFTPGAVQRIEGPFQGLERDRNGGLYLPGRGNERVRYTIWGHTPERNTEALLRDHATSPVEPGPGGSRPTTRYLQLPDFDPGISERAAEIVSGSRNDLERALSLRDHLRRNGRYTDTPPALGDAETSPIEGFILGDLEGHCEYFASAMVVLARSQGLPSRLVNGFAGGQLNEVGGFVEVSRADAHAWVEIHFEDGGWVRFDPTPADLRLRASDGLSLWARVGQLGSAIELWWFQSVVDFDSADQIGAMRGLWMRWKERQKEGRAPGESDPPRRHERSWENPLRGVDPIVIFGGFTLLIGGVALWRRPRSAVGPSVPESYRSALRTLARAGWTREPVIGARAFAQSIRSSLPAGGAAAFEEITERYLEERFGHRPSSDLRAELAALQDSIDRMGLGDQTHVR
jgi:hypothetical protein